MCSAGREAHTKLTNIYDSPCSLNSFASLSLLRQWYGESYPYASNPLALPLSLEDIAERILPYNKVFYT